MYSTYIEEHWQLNNVLWNINYVLRIVHCVKLNTVYIVQYIVQCTVYLHLTRVVCIL